VFAVGIRFWDNTAMNKPSRCGILFSAMLLPVLFPGCMGRQEEKGAQAMSRNEPLQIRQAIGAGRWFPGERQELSRLVSDCMDSADHARTEGRIVSAISPHAGYIYSGPVAGHTFRAIRDAAAAGNGPETVVIAGFSHSQGFRGVALMDGDAVRTPLGDAAIDAEANRILMSASDLIREDYRPHNGEHSAENQIPFVQAALPEAKVVVALMGDHEMRTVEAFVDAMKLLGESRSVLFVASTDLLHDPDYDKVARADRSTLDLISKLRVEELSETWSISNQVCCGIMPVLTAMRYAQEQGCSKGKLLYYRNSGDDYPESRGSWVVGYGSVVFAVK